MRVQAKKAFYYKSKTIEEGKTAIVDAKTGKFLVENKLAAAEPPPKENTQEPAQ